MDRDLQIALVSGALAIVFGYGLSQRLRMGDTQVQFKMVYRKDNPGAFWTVMFIAGVAEAAFIVVAIVHFAAWLQSR